MFLAQRHRQVGRSGAAILLALAQLLLPALPARAQQQAASPDAFEPNDSPQQVLAQSPQKSYLQAGQVVDNLNFHKESVADEGDVDWFYFFAKDGANYKVQTSVMPGVDTELFVYYDTGSTNAPAASTALATNDDARPGTRASEVTFRADRSARYWIKVWNKDPSPRASGTTYSVRIEEVFPPTAVPTNPPPPTRTPFPGRPDRFEYNGDFGSASPIQLDLPLTGLNFMPFNAQKLEDVDNDFFALSVKTGETYTCETFGLSPGTDTNMIVYDLMRQGIGGNDDADKFNGVIGSRFTWRSSYNGLAYILIGDVQPAPANLAASRIYSLKCYLGGPVLPTPTPGPPTLPPTATPTTKPTLEPTSTPTPQPTETKTPPTPTATSIPPTAALFPVLVPPPPSAPVFFPTTIFPANLPFRPLPRDFDNGAAPNARPTVDVPVRVINILAFIDNNRNQRLDMGEAMPGLTVVILDALTLEPLDIATTDATGSAGLAVVNSGPIRVTVPLLGYNVSVIEANFVLQLIYNPTNTIEKLP